MGASRKPPLLRRTTRPSRRPSRPRRAAERRGRFGRLGSLLGGLGAAAAGPRGRWVTLAAAVVVLSLGLWLVWPFFQLAGQFSTHPYVQPSRLYETPPRVEVGQALTAAELASALRARGYRAFDGEGPLPAGGYRRSGDRALEVALRSFPSPRGWTVPLPLVVRFRRGWVDAIEAGEDRVDAAWYDPMLVASYYGPDRLDRWPESVSDLPPYVVSAVLAAEDDRFFEHRGLSIRGIARALWSNLRNRRVEQGGSTLTQQLVKNLYLTHQRTLVRKLREAGIAVLLEVRHSKNQILQAYLNEIYLGRADGVNVMGIGSAARAYFGVPATELGLGQAAAIAGMIRSPAALSPLASLERSQQRRDVVLRRMHELGWLDEGALDAALAEELELAPDAVRPRARYAADAAADEVAQRFGVASLADRGYTVVSTLEAKHQIAAEEAVVEVLAALDERAGDAAEPLQGVLVSAVPGSGAVRAWVGGRDYGRSQFDRVRLMKRQPGSAFKPVVLTAALADGRVTLADRLLDEPITVRRAGQKSWEPQNDDREFHGDVGLREVFERSLNVPVVRLALQTGLERVVYWARELGVESSLGRVPSLSLGAFELTPLELLRVYSTLAAEGRRPSLHLVEGVLDRTGEVVAGESVPGAHEVLTPDIAYLVTSVLEGVVAHGTGRRLRQLGLQDAVAAKSGTSSGRRDSWFVGYSPNLAALAWVGFDGGEATRLSGSSAALPIWGRYLRAVRPATGYRLFQPPEGVRTMTVDRYTGQLATAFCPETMTETFLEDRVPEVRCSLHSFDENWDWGRDEERPGFWRRLFRGGSRRGVGP